MGIVGVNCTGVPERETINIGISLAHPHLNCVNVERRVSRLRIHLAPGRKLLPLLHRTDVICALYLKDRNKYSRRYKYIYETHISRTVLALYSIGKLRKRYTRSYNRRGRGSMWTFIMTIICKLNVWNFFIASIPAEGVIFKTKDAKVIIYFI